MISDSLAPALNGVVRAADLAGKLSEHAERVHGANSRDARAAAAISYELEQVEKTLRRAGVESSDMAGHGGPSLDVGELRELEQGCSEALELAAALRGLLPLAEKLDRARGHVVTDAIPLQPGETASVDTAELLSDLCYRLEQEVGGATGKGLE